MDFEVEVEVAEFVVHVLICVRWFTFSWCRFLCGFEFEVGQQSVVIFEDVRVI